MEKLKGIIQKWNSISLVKRIICGLIMLSACGCHAADKT